MKRILCVGAVLCLALLCSIPAFSQTDRTGAIAGRAQDSTGAVIPGVEVSISSPAMIGGDRKEVTDETGTARFTLLPPGNYTVTFSLPGFKTNKVENVDLNAGTTRQITGNLEVASSSTEITITGASPQIDLESATVGVSFSQKMIDDLPWSRSLTGISMMIPGAYSTSYDVGNSNFGTGSTIAARSGGRSGGNVVTIDGLVWCQTYSDYGSFEEMNVSTNAKGAEQMNSGITISMVAKSGGNVFHGNASAKYQNGSMQSNNVTDELIAQGFPVGSSKLTHFTDFYGDIGGPILKNKLWFYGAYRQGYQGTFIPGFRTGVGGPQAEFYTVLKSPTAKLTWQISEKQKLEAYVSIPDKFQPYRGGTALVPRDATQDQDSWSSQGPVLTYTNILDSKTSFTAKVARGGYWWPAYTYSMPDGLGPNIAQLTPGGLVMQRIPTLNFVGVPNVGVRINDTTTGATDGGFGSNYARPIRWQWNFDVSRFAKIAGRNNELKAGYMGWWDKDYNINFGYPYAQQYRYKSLTSESCPNSEICSNYFLHPNSVIVYDYPNNNSTGAQYKAAYVNDKITLNRKLTLNVGLRWDWATSFLPPQGNDGTGAYATKFQIGYQKYVTNPDGTKADFPVYNMFSPRVSFAYDVTGNGRLALKASYGRYVGMTSSPNSQPGPGANSGSVNPMNTTSCTYNNWDGSIPFDAKKNFGPDGIMGSADDLNLSASCAQTSRNAAGQVVAIRTYNFDDNLQSTYLDEYAAGVEMAISHDYSVRVDVSRKFDKGGSKTVNVLTPYSAYSDVRCATDLGRDGKSGTADDNPFGPVCTYSIPNSNPNRTVTNILYSNVDMKSHENQSAYTGYDATFSKNYSHKWSLLAGYGISLAHPNTMNPLTPDQQLYNSQSQLPTWSQSWKFNGVYGIPDIPLFRGFKLGGIQWASTMTAQSGDWYARTAQVTNALGTSVTQTVEGHYGRYAWVPIWDQRVSKRFKLDEKGHTLEFTWDLFNTTNSNQPRTWRSTSVNSSNYLQPDGTTPLRPATIIAPRIYQWGATFKF